eukprot:jgi/Botrbrau1/13798/Bobra.0056s0046.1
MTSWRSCRRKPLALEHSLSQRGTSFCNQRWQVPGRVPQLGSHFRTPEGPVELSNANSLATFPESRLMKSACDTKHAVVSQQQQVACNRFPDALPSSQVSQSHLSGLHFSEQHFTTAQQWNPHVTNAPHFNSAYCKAQPLLTQPGSQATCNNGSLPTSMSQPQSQITLVDPLAVNPTDGFRPKSSATPVPNDTKIQQCRQMQLKGASAAGLTGSFSGVRPSPVAAQLLKQVTNVSNQEETSKEVLGKLHDLQKEFSALHTTLAEIRQQGQTCTSLGNSVAIVQTEISAIKELLMEIKVDAEKIRTVKPITKLVRDQSTSANILAEHSEHVRVEESITHSEVTRSEPDAGPPTLVVKKRTDHTCDKHPSAICAQKSTWHCKEGPKSFERQNKPSVQHQVGSKAPRSPEYHDPHALAAPASQGILGYDVPKSQKPSTGIYKDTSENCLCRGFWISIPRQVKLLRWKSFFNSLHESSLETGAPPTQTWPPRS